MRLGRLRIESIRALRDVDIEPGRGLNWLVGANGAGKTSVLEAIHLLSRGRSFRGGGDDALLQRGGSGFTIYAEVGDDHGHRWRLGLGRSEGKWDARVDGVAQATLGGLLQHCAVVCFEPGSHELLSGGPQIRRRFLDWGVFHVEHDYLDAWQRCQRALKQRNRLLRDGAIARDLEPWNAELDAAAVKVDAARNAYITAFAARLADEMPELTRALGGVRVRYRRGWPADTSLADALVETCARDLARGHTGLGPHRADWQLVFEDAPSHDHLSRGQEKMAALACLFAQAAEYAAGHGDWPIVCLDDLMSELDAEHGERALAKWLGTGAQLWVTGTREPAVIAESRMFHVEQGRVSAA